MTCQFCGEDGHDDNSYMLHPDLWEKVIGKPYQSLMPLLPVRSRSCKGQAGGRRRCRAGIGMRRAGFACG
jgi:hypothetical protein